jgi:hypothetical protein
MPGRDGIAASPGLQAIMEKKKPEGGFPAKVAVVHPSQFTRLILAISLVKDRGF